jgi:hypothetical protein
MTDNMHIWNRVKDSDPKHLKKVSFGARSFTSIDPHSQIETMTREYGPVGLGWGWHAVTKVIHIGDGRMLYTAEVEVWTVDRANVFGPFPGSRLLVSDKGKPNEDAPKMAVTDGLTKALSHLGLNADVFLGLRDADKYSDPKRQDDF